MKFHQIGLLLNVVTATIEPLSAYESRKLKKAQDWNRKMGLDSVKKQKDYVFKTPFKFKKV